MAQSAKGLRDQRAEGLVFRAYLLFSGGIYESDHMIPKPTRKVDNVNDSHRKRDDHGGPYFPITSRQQMAKNRNQDEEPQNQDR